MRLTLGNRGGKPCQVASESRSALGCAGLGQQVVYHTCAFCWEQVQKLGDGLDLDSHHIGSF